MTGHDHERAMELIMRRGTEDLAAQDLHWLHAHLESCSDCARYGEDFERAGQWLRAVAVTASSSLVATTQAKLRARAMYLSEQRSRVVLIAISFCIGTMTSVMSAWLWWRFGAWVATHLGLPQTVVQPAMFIVSMLPALVIAIAISVTSHPVIDRSLTMTILGEHQEGAQR